MNDWDVPSFTARVNGPMPASLTLWRLPGLFAILGRFISVPRQK